MDIYKNTIVKYEKNGVNPTSSTFLNVFNKLQRPLALTSDRHCLGYWT